MRTIKSNQFDDYLHERLYSTDEDNQQERRTNLNNSIGRWEETYIKSKESKEISKDLFNSFFNKGLEYTDEPNPLLKAFIDEVKDSLDFKSIKDNTVGNDFLSYCAGKELQDKFSEVLPELSKKMEELQKNEQPNSSKEIEELESMINKNKDKIKSKFRQIIRKIDSDLQDTKEMFQIAGFDLSESTNDKKEIKGKLELAKKLTSNPKFKEIIDMIGRRMNLANHSIKTSTNFGCDEVVGIEQGNNIVEALPSELVMLSDTDMIDSFLKNYSNSSLLQWKNKGKNTESNGDIILIMDQSGSMKGDLDIYAKSFAFGLWCMAKSTHKKLHLIPFANNAKVVEIQSERELMDFLNYFMNGGTNYDNPLKLANSIIESTSKKADIFFLTDGEGQLTEEVLKQFKENKIKNGFKVLGVNLADGINEVLKKFCDKIWNFTLLEGKQSNDFLTEAFSSII